MFCLGYVILVRGQSDPPNYVVLASKVKPEKGILPKERAIQGGSQVWIDFWYCPQLRP